MANTLRNLRLSQRLLQVIGLLEEARIECMAYKGPATALQAYGDTALRQFTDLDLLIHPEDFARVYAVLLQAGWQPYTPLNQKEQRWLVKTAVEFQLTKGSDLLEIHWGITLPEFLHPLKTAIFWEGRMTLELLERRLPTLSLERAVFFTCLHATKHGCASLKTPVDLAHLSDLHPELDWLRLIDCSHRYGFQRLLCLNLLLAETLGGAVFPTDVHDRIHADAPAQSLATRVVEQMVNGRASPDPTERLFFYFQCRERLRDKLYLVLAQAFVPKEVDWRLLPLPEQLYFLYYLIHPVRSLAKLCWLLLSWLVGRTFRATRQSLGQILRPFRRPKQPEGPTRNPHKWP